MVTFEPTAGSNISNSCVKAVDMARQHGESIALSFNGRLLTVHPNSRPSDIANEYYVRCEEDAKQARDDAARPVVDLIAAARRALPLLEHLNEWKWGDDEIRDDSQEIIDNLRTALAAMKGTP